jgi:hypothetical protein
MKPDDKSDHIKLSPEIPSDAFFKGKKYSIKTSKAEINWLDSINIPNEYRQIKISVGSTICFVDGYDPESKTIYSFYGDFWHGNPKKYHPSKINKRVRKTFGQLYNLTIAKEKKLIEAGYKIISMWESDWMEYNEQK